MRFPLLVVLLSTFLPWLAAEDKSAPAYQWVRLLNPGIRDDEARVEELQSRLSQLPPLSPGHSGANVGTHSRFQESRDGPFEVTIDLGKIQPIDRIVVFPVQGMFRGEMIEGYGFPEHFVIELSQDADFADRSGFFDSKDAPRPLPNYPTQFSPEDKIEARYVRIKVLKHWAREDGQFLTALGELMVLSGGRNVALYSTVVTDSFTSLPDWYRDHLVDGQTDLGLPVSPEPSPSNGFLSLSSKDPATEKWIQLELPRLSTIDEVVIIPAQPVDAPDQFGHGFPQKFRLLVSADADFENAKVIADYSEARFPNPGDNPVVFPAGGYAAKFVKMEVTEMWHISTGVFSVTLAEMQVVEGVENVAIGAAVTASDVFRKEEFLHVWRPEYLVDGYSSQNRLMHLEDWLEGLDVRRDVELRIEELGYRIEAKASQTLGWILSLSTVMILGSISLVAVLIVRRKQTLAQHQEALRARIARDLHDDLGSRLGGMRLISENLLNAGELPESLRRDLDLLHRSSGEATDAMRDIVWLLDTRERSLEKLRQQLKLLVPSILGSMPWEFHVDGAPDAEVNFEFRRQIVLAFRESLNNAVRHSESPRFDCRVGGDRENFWFEVRDLGKGFDETTIRNGLGLNNLRRRAESLGGVVSIESQAEAGTVIRFSAPYHRSKTNRLP